MTSLRTLWHSALHLFYPHICLGCDSDILPHDELLCAQCIVQLPHTNFATQPDNAVEKTFTGRLVVSAAFAQFYFNKDTVIQRLVHQLKYKGHKAIGLYLGRMMGQSLLNNDRFSAINCLVPLPLHIVKEKQRGYNQAAILCQGMAEVLGLPVDAHSVTRQRNTKTQTHQHRTSRWQNVEGSFAIANPDALAGKHILLVDDVVTTGATLDACGNAILQLPDTSLSIATLAFAHK